MRGDKGPVNKRRDTAPVTVDSQRGAAGLLPDQLARLPAGTCRTGSRPRLCLVPFFFRLLAAGQPVPASLASRRCGLCKVAGRRLRATCFHCFDGHNFRNNYCKFKFTQEYSAYCSRKFPASKTATVMPNASPQTVAVSGLWNWQRA